MIPFSAILVLPGVLLTLTLPERHFFQHCLANRVKYLPWSSHVTSPKHHSKNGCRTSSFLCSLQSTQHFHLRHLIVVMRWAKWAFWHILQKKAYKTWPVQSPVEFPERAGARTLFLRTQVSWQDSHSPQGRRDSERKSDFRPQHHDSHLGLVCWKKALRGRRAVCSCSSRVGVSSGHPPCTLALSFMWPLLAALQLFP